MSTHESTMDTKRESKESEEVNMKTVSRASSGNEPLTGKIYGMKAHWKCLAACSMVSMAPFQYGTHL